MILILPKKNILKIKTIIFYIKEIYETFIYY